MDGADLHRMCVLINDSKLENVPLFRERVVEVLRECGILATWAPDGDEDWNLRINHAEGGCPDAPVSPLIQTVIEEFGRKVERAAQVSVEIAGRNYVLA